MNENDRDPLAERSRMIASDRRVAWGSKCFFLLVIFACATGPATHGGIILPSGISETGDPSELTPQILGVRDGKQAGAGKLNEAIDEFRRGDLTEALRKLEAAAEENAALPPPRVMLARMLIATSQPQIAREVLEGAAVELPASPHLHVAFGSLAAIESRVADALLHFEKAKAMLVASGDRDEAVSAEIQQGFAWVAERRQQWSDAETFLGSLLRIRPDDSNARHRLGVALFHQDEVAKSEEALRAAAAADSALDPAALTLAWLSHQSGADEQALQWMAIALQEAGEDPRVLRAAAMLHYDRHDLTVSRTHVAKWLQAQPDSGEAILFAATLARAAGDTEQSRELLERRLIDEPADFGAAYQLVLLLVDSDDPVQRQRGLQRADLLRRQFSDAPLAITAFAWAVFRANSDLSSDQQKELVSLFEQASLRGVTDAEVIYQFAQLLTATQASQRGEEVLAELLASNQPFPGRPAAVARHEKTHSESNAAKENPKVIEP